MNRYMPPKTGAILAIVVLLLLIANTIEADSMFDESMNRCKAAMGQGDYIEALRMAGQAQAQSPNDSRPYQAMVFAGGRLLFSADKTSLTDDDIRMIRVTVSAFRTKRLEGFDHPAVLSVLRGTYRVRSERFFESSTPKGFQSALIELRRLAALGDNGSRAMADWLRANAYLNRYASKGAGADGIAAVSAYKATLANTSGLSDLDLDKPEILAMMHYSIGAIEHDAGHYAVAITQLETASSLVPSDADIQRALVIARASAKGGPRKSLREMLAKVLQLQ